MKEMKVDLRAANDTLSQIDSNFQMTFISTHVNIIKLSHVNHRRQVAWGVMLS